MPRNLFCCELPEITLCIISPIPAKRDNRRGRAFDPPRCGCGSEFIQLPNTTNKKSQPSGYLGQAFLIQKMKLVSGTEPTSDKFLTLGGVHHFSDSLDGGCVASCRACSTLIGRRTKLERHPN